MYGMTSMLRLGFIVTFYIYENTGNPSIINSIHFKLIWFYLLCWGVELIHDSIVFVFEVIEAVRICSKNKPPRKIKTVKDDKNWKKGLEKNRKRG